MPESLKKSTFRGLIWSSAERLSVQGIQFLSMLVIARILSPKDYGLVGMLAIFLAVAQSFIDSGFSQALIRKENRTNIDDSTVFYFNIVVSFLLYIVLYAVSPMTANFYNEPELCQIMRVISLVVVINGFAVVQRAIFTIEINFKTQAKASFIAAILSCGLGIFLAFRGFGVWTLVYMQLLNALANTILLWIYSSWRPILAFSRDSFNEMFSFGSKLMLSGLINTLYNNIYQLVIGKIFSASSLGFYSRASQFAQLPSANITGILQRVTYPVLCKIQDDREKYVSATRKFLRLFSYIVFPIMCLLAGISRPLILILLGEKWEPAASLLIPLCFAFMLYPVHALNLNVITVIGRSDLFLKLEIIKKVIAILILVVSIPFGLLAMCYGSILGSVLSLFVNTYYSGREVGYGLYKQACDLSHITFLSLGVFAAVMLINTVLPNVYVQLTVDFIIAFALFISVSYLFKFEELAEIINLLKNKNNL